MDLSTSTTSIRQSTGGQRAISGEFQRQSPRTASIHTLDDDALLHVFYFCRPFLLDEYDIADWRYNGYWWYSLAHVCQRWRYIALGSATHLGLSLVCTYGTPVADMLAHSPPLPLAIGYFEIDHELTTEDEEGISLALKQHGRVRHIRFGIPATIMQTLLVAMDEEYPILEYVFITPPIKDNSTILRFPEAFQAPHLRQLTLKSFALPPPVPIGSRLLMAAVGLVTLELVMAHSSTYFPPNTLLQWISNMPQLETLIISFGFSTPNRDIERQLIHSPIIAPITLPNLHLFHLRGVSSYLETLVHRIATPRLEALEIDFFNQLTFSGPHLQQFIGAAGNLRFGNVVLTFSDELVGARVYPLGETRVSVLSIVIQCWHLDWQVSSMAQIFNSLSQMFSAVERLVLQHVVHRGSSEEHNEVDRAEWRKLLGPLRNVKTLRIRNELVEDLSRCLDLEDGELPLELLPELHDLEYFWSRDTGDAFTSFIDARRNAGRPVTLVRL